MGMGLDKNALKNAMAGSRLESGSARESRENKENWERKEQEHAQKAFWSLREHLRGSVKQSRGEIEHHKEGKTEGINEMIKSPLSIEDLENFMLGWDKIPEDFQKLILVVYPEVATAVLRKKLADFSDEQTLPPYRENVEKL